MKVRSLGWRLAASALLATPITILLVQLTVAWPVGQFDRDAVFGELIGGTAGGQTFIADKTWLYRIDVFLATFARSNQGPVIFHLKTSPAAMQDLVMITFDAAQVQDNAFRTFVFKPLANTPGEPLYFYLEAPEAQPNNAITIWGTRRDSYSGGEMVLVNLPNINAVSDLAFRLYYYPTNMPQAFREMLDRLAGGKPSIFGLWELYGALWGAYMLLLLWLGWTLGELRDDKTLPGSAESQSASPDKHV